MNTDTEACLAAVRTALEGKPEHETLERALDMFRRDVRSEALKEVADALDQKGFRTCAKRVRRELKRK